MASEKIKLTIEYTEQALQRIEQRIKTEKLTPQEYLHLYTELSKLLDRKAKK